MLSPFFLILLIGEKKLNNIIFNTLEEAFEHYGRENLIPIDFIKQQLFYAKNGCQPEFIWEKETDPGRLTCWYLKSKTSGVYKAWMDNRPPKKD